MIHFKQVKQKFLKSRFLKSLVVSFISISALFVPLISAFSAPAVVPVGAELIGELLVALGLMAGNSADGYTWVNSDNPYVESVFETQVGNITNGVPISSEVLGDLSGTVIPENVYTTDGTRFYIGDKEISSSDLFLSAKSLVGVVYDMPTNIISFSPRSGILPSNTYFTSYFSPSDIGSGKYYIPYCVDNTGSFLFRLGVSAVDDSTYYMYDFSSSSSSSEKALHPMESFICYPTVPSMPAGNVAFCTSPSAYPSSGEYFSFSGVFNGARYERVSGSGDVSFDFSTLLGSTCLITDGVPIMDIIADSQRLDGALVQVKPTDDDSNNGSSPPAPQSPNNWEIWQTLEALLDQVQTGTPTNGGTTFGQYVNNNYNYVDVDINVPDEINNNVNLSGGLDINGKGDVNITINEEVSLPSAGDGSGFFTPSATNVIGAIAKDNPVISTLSALFSALDPALVGIVSVSISLLLVLGLWKLIRG